MAVSESQGSLKRPRICENSRPAIEAIPSGETKRIMESFQERIELGEKCLQLQADVEQRSTEIQSLQEHTRAVLREFAKCRREKEALEDEALKIRSRIKEEPVCVVCLTERASYVIVPCGHLALCSDCCSHPIHQCPLCRHFCEQKLRVFRP
jgi:hypothetical protein